MYVVNVNNYKILFGLIDLFVGGFNDVISYVLVVIVGVIMWLL